MNKTSGTKEWADSNVNCFYGCSNNCRYCYAKKMALRFKRKSVYDWELMDINIKALMKQYKKRNGRIMFPTSHDITPNPLVLETCVQVLLKLLRAKNQVLITTKPHPKVIDELCFRLEDFKDLIQFRFTITSLNKDLLKYWEPNAPTFKERFISLRRAFKRGFKTSISIEPFLDKDPGFLVWACYPFVTETIWIGPMNHTKLDGLRDAYSVENLKKIYGEMRILEKVRFKDSFLRRINLLD